MHIPQSAESTYFSTDFIDKLTVDQRGEGESSVTANNITQIAQQNISQINHFQVDDNGLSEKLKRCKSREIDTVATQNLVYKEELQQLRNPGIKIITQKDCSNFIKACEIGDIQIVKEFINQGIDIDVKNEVGKTALICAAASGHKDIVALLLQNHAQIDARDNFDSTALIYAAASGHRDVVALLLKHNAQVDIEDDFDATALIHATVHGHKDIVELLLKKNALINLRSCFHMTALMHAAFLRHSEIVALLIEKEPGLDIGHLNLLLKKFPELSFLKELDLKMRRHPADKTLFVAIATLLKSVSKKINQEKAINWEPQLEEKLESQLIEILNIKSIIDIRTLDRKHFIDLDYVNSLELCMPKEVQFFHARLQKTRENSQYTDISFIFQE